MDGEGREAERFSASYFAELREETETGFVKTKGNHCFENMFAVFEPNHINQTYLNDLEI